MRQPADQVVASTILYDPRFSHAKQYIIKSITMSMLLYQLAPTLSHPLRVHLLPALAGAGRVRRRAFRRRIRPRLRGRERGLRREKRKCGRHKLRN